MTRCLVLLNVCLLAASARSAVNVVVQDSNGVATIKYECTAGEVVRSFALDVSLDKGRIVGISNFFRGVSGVGAQGYGIFPAAFRDHVTVSSGTNANWDVSDYTPLAVVADSPGNTLPASIPPASRSNSAVFGMGTHRPPFQPRRARCVRCKSAKPPRCP